jgi:copper chaperone
LHLANGFTVSLPTQDVLVWGPSLPSFDEVTEKIAKTGKEIQSKRVIETEADIPVIQAA